MWIAVLEIENIFLRGTSGGCFAKRYFTFEKNLRKDRGNTYRDDGNQDWDQSWDRTWFRL
jgi:hypothetical protein